MKHIIITPVLLIPVAFALISCAGTSNPTLGSRIASEGNAVADIGKDWDKGDAMIKKGEKMKRKGKEAIVEGDELIKQGKEAKRRAEAAYKAKGVSSSR